MARSDSEQPTDRRRWIVLAVCASASGAMILDIAKANVALPAIEGVLHAGPLGLQLITSGYILAFALTLLPAGWLGDRGGRRLMQLLGLGLYIVASAAAAFAPGVELLIAARMVQGVAAGLVMPQNMGTVQQLFSGADRARAFGVYGIAVSLSVAAGPSVGGLLTTLGGPEYGWRWVFGMNLPLGLVLLAAAAIVIPRARQVVLRRGFDGIGLLLIGATLALVLLPIVTTTGRHGDDPRRWLLLVAAAVPAAALLWWERRLSRRGGDPLLDPVLLSLPSYRNGVTIALFWFSSQPGLMLVLTLFLQLSVGLSPLFAALLVLPSALLSAASGWIASRHVLRRGRQVTVLGVGIVAAGTVATLASALLLPVEVIPWAVLAGQAISGFGSGMVISPNHTMTLFDVPQDRGSMAGSISQLGQRVGNSLGLAAGSAVFFGVVYGSSGGLATATDGVYRTGLLAAGLLALTLICVTGGIALYDRARQVRIAGSENGAIMTLRGVI